VESAARRAASFLDDARRRAVLERRVRVVRCRLREDRLVLDGIDGGEQSFRLPESVTLAACSPEEIRYLPQGSASGMTVLLRDRRGRERRLGVGSFTGLASVETPR